MGGLKISELKHVDFDFSVFDTVKGVSKKTRFFGRTVDCEEYGVVLEDTIKEFLLECVDLLKTRDITHVLNAPMFMSLTSSLDGRFYQRAG